MSERELRLAQIEQNTTADEGDAFWDISYPDVCSRLWDSAVDRRYLLGELAELEAVLATLLHTRRGWRRRRRTVDELLAERARLRKEGEVAGPRIAQACALGVAVDYEGRSLIASEVAIEVSKQIVRHIL